MVKLGDVAGGCLVSTIFSMTIMVAIFIGSDYGVTLISRAQPFFYTANTILFPIAVISLLLCLVRKARPLAGAVLSIIAWWWGVVLWLGSFAITYQTWGAMGLVIGTLVLGVGVLLTGLAALIATNQTSAALLFCVSIIVVVAVSVFGNWISRRE
jgi:hypothetical protein